MSGWRVVVPRWTTLPGGQRTRTWVPDPGLPTFATPAEARRAYMERLDADLIGKPDDFIERHWRAWRSNVHGAKLERC
jgi:hypothetical protein